MNLSMSGGWGGGPVTPGSVYRSGGVGDGGLEGGALDRVAKVVDEEIERNDPQYNEAHDGVDRFEADSGWQSSSYDKDYERDDAGIEFSASGMVESVPEPVAARLENMEDICFYGLLAPLGLAWVSVDDTLSLWLPAPAPAPRPPPRVIHCADYISAVGLVRTDPSKAYACESVGPYLLVVAMRECVQLYSLHQSDTEFVVLETGMEVPVESLVCSMVCTDNGRIMVGCSDGCVYELHYTTSVTPSFSLSSFWRPAKMRKTSCQGLRWGEIGRRVTSLWQPYVADPVLHMAYDPSRHVVFALTRSKQQLPAQGAAMSHAPNTLIHAYVLGSNGEGAPRHVGPVKLSLLASSVDARNRDIVAVHAVQRQESTRYSCVLVSSTGYRFYISLSDSGMVLRMVKPPPRYLTGGAGRPQASGGGNVSVVSRQNEEITPRVQASLYSNGVFILCMPGWIVCVVQDRNRESYRPGVGESREVFSVFEVPTDTLGQPVHVWQVAELQSVMRWGDVSLLTRDSRMRSTHDLWTQHLTHPRRFLLLGGSGVMLLHRRQPWEKLDYACRSLGLLQGQRALQGHDLSVYRTHLRFPKEQACATSLLWWVMTMGDRLGANAAHSLAASVLLDVKNQGPAVQSNLSLLAQSQGPTQAPTDPRFRGILIALSRFLRPVWSEKIFAGPACSVTQDEWRQLVSQLQLVSRFLSDYEDRLPGRQLEVTVREIRDFVNHCRELCSLMSIITRDSLWGSLVQSRDVDLSQSKDLDFRTLVLRVVCRPHENSMMQQQLLSVVLKLIQHTAISTTPMSPGSASEQMSRAASKREALIRDIEAQCPNVFKPFERSKMHAERWLSEAKEARDTNAERLQVCLVEARQHYMKVSKDLNTDDLRRMCDCFLELGQHISALQVLLKRFSEQVEVAGAEADLYRILIERLALVDEQGPLETGLELSLSNKGLYRLAIRGELAEPAVYGVYRAIVENPNSGFLWPLLRRLPLLRKAGAAQQYLVEFLRFSNMPEKLVDLYNESGQYSKAGEVCVQQANARCAIAQHGGLVPTLQDRIHWFRQGAKAAKLNGGALNNHTQASLLDQYADVANIQQHLVEYLEAALGSLPHEASALLDRLQRELLSMQEIFERACEFDCYDVAMEVCETVSSGGDVQAGYLNLSLVLSKLWKLILNKAWKGDATNSDDGPEEAWARVEAAVCHVGRRFTRKEGFLPLHDLVAWLEECAHKNFYCTQPNQEAWNEACRAEGRDHCFWCGEGGWASLSAPAFRVPRLLLLSLGVEQLKLVKVYCDMLDSAVLSSDGKRRVHCFRTLVMLYTVFLRDARDTDQEAMLPFAAIENDFVRLEAKPGVYAAELQQARGLLKALRMRREGFF